MSIGGTGEATLGSHEPVAPAAVRAECTQPVPPGLQDLQGVPRGGCHRLGAVSKRILRDNPQVITTGAGLRYQIVTEGEGDSPGPASRVKVHYLGTLADGTVFDSSRERGQPTVFALNQVIRGWTEGLQLMKPGAVYRFVIPSDLAYGDSGAGSVIPAGATLTFEVELISIEKP